MTSPAAGKRRMDQDVIRLIESNHEVEIMDSLKHFMVKFIGPKVRFLADIKIDTFPNGPVSLSKFLDVNIF